MLQQVVPILLGFLLTTVVGGAFASFLQQRSWRHQNRSKLYEEDRQRASDVCTSLSSLVDKRCYRMRRLHWAVVGHAAGHVTRDELATRLQNYQQILFEWNDQLNARLAIIGAFFGRDVRDFLDAVVYEAFKDAGRRIEALYRQASEADQTELDEDEVADVVARLDQLSHYAYQLSLAMMVRIREGKVGRLAPDLLADKRLQAESDAPR